MGELWTCHAVADTAAAVTDNAPADEIAASQDIRTSSLPQIDRWSKMPKPIGTPNRQEPRTRHGQQNSDIRERIVAMKIWFAALCSIALLGTQGYAKAPAEAVIKVGAAKVDITPAADNLPKGYEGILDHGFSRAIVFENGKTKAAVVTLDVGGVANDTVANVTARAAKELGIPATNILITATHTHAIPRLEGQSFEDKIVQALREAKEKAQPARMFYGTGVSYINVNRNFINPATHRWWEGPNYEGTSDKTVAVVNFTTLSGKPIAVYYNYAIHPVITGQLDLLSADIPGASSTYLEETLGNGAVAVWSSGASGDQNPIYYQQSQDLRDIRIKDFASRGIDISNAMPPSGQGMNKKDPQVIFLMNQQKQMKVSMGQMLAEEVLHVLHRNLERPITSTAIFGAQTTVTCPGRARTDSGRAGYPGTYVDADPIPIRLSLLNVGDVMIGGVNGEVFNTIAQRLKYESPFKHTMMVTLTNGKAPSGYIPNDVAFGYNTFEVVASHLKPGCAETAIVDGLLDLMQKAGSAH
jgi:neutral ceramidase